MSRKPKSTTQRRKIPRFAIAAAHGDAPAVNMPGRTFPRSIGVGVVACKTLLVDEEQTLTVAANVVAAASVPMAVQIHATQARVHHAQ